MIPLKLFSASFVLAFLFLTIGCGGTSSGLSVSPSHLSFTGVDAGYATGSQTVTVTNNSNSPVLISNNQIDGPNAFNFSRAGGCNSITLAPAASCTVTVTFTPQAVGNYSAALDFTINTSVNARSVTLSGTYAGTAAPTAAAKFGFAASDYGTINSFTIASTGVWTPTTPATVDAGDYTGAMIVDPLGKYLFFAGFLNGNISSYTITLSTGVPVYNSQASPPYSDTRPEDMTVDPTGRFVYVSNTGLSSVSEYNVDRSTGKITAGTTVAIPNVDYPSISQSSPTGIVVDPSGKYLYVASIGLISMFSIDQTTGALTPLSTPSLQGGGCFTLRLDSTGKFVYCSIGRGSGETIYAINANTGILSYATQLGHPIAAGDGSADIGFTFDGKFAYVVNRDDNTISLFLANNATGIIAPLTPSLYSTIGQPYLIAMDPGGQIAYIDSEAGGIVTMRINADGTLSYMGLAPVANAPVALAIYPSTPSH